MRNQKWCAYTLRHRRAFEYCVKKLIHEPMLREEMMKRARVHDMDKMVLYLVMEQKEAQALHVKTAPHHLENDLPRTYEDYVEVVLDYECAPYTKPDKPLNAFDFINMLMERGYLDEDTGAVLLEITKDLGIDNSNSVSGDKAGFEYIAGLPEVTEEMIANEIIAYVTGKID